MQPARPAVVTIARCSSLIEAQVMRARLGAHGIAAHLPDEVSAAVLCESFDGTSGVRVRVAGDDAARACELLGIGAECQPDEAAAGAETHHCEVCRAAQPERRLGLRLLRWIPLPAHPCPVCGHVGPRR